MSKVFFSERNGSRILFRNRDALRGLSTERILCLTETLTYLMYRSESLKGGESVSEMSVLRKLGADGAYPVEHVQASLQWLRRHRVILLTAFREVQLLPNSEWFHKETGDDGSGQDVQDIQD